MKTIKDILPLVEWNNVRRALAYFYPKTRGDAEPIFKRLLEFPKRKHKDQEEFIEIKTYNNLEEKEFGPLDHNYYNTATNKYSLSFRKWAEVVNIPISESTLEHFKFEDIVAHFIWEITWYGGEEETEKKGMEMLSSFKKAKEEIKKLNKK